MLKRLILGFLLLASAAYAQTTKIPLVTGPQDISSTNAALNNLINQINNGNFGGVGGVSSVTGNSNNIICSPTTGAVLCGATYPSDSYATSNTIATSDLSQLVGATNATGSITFTLPSVGTTGFGSGASFDTCEFGAGSLTFTSATAFLPASAPTLTTGQCATFASNGTNWLAAFVGSGGSGNGTVNTGTAGNIAYYATSTNAVSDGGTASLHGGGLVLVNANAASSSRLLLQNTVFTGGTGTTTTPTMNFQTGAATAVSTWGTSGTFLGMNADSGFSGNFMDFHINGGAALFSVSSGGSATLGSTAGLTFSGRTKTTSPSDGVLLYTNNAATSFTRMDFGGTSASFMGLTFSGTTIALTASDGTIPTYASCIALTTNASGVIGCTASDERLKNFGKSIPGNDAGAILAKISAGRTFNWKDQKAYDGKIHIGLSAQDVCKADQRLCASRHVVKDGKVSMEFNYEDRGLISLLVANNQSLTARVAVLEKQVKARR